MKNTISKMKVELDSFYPSFFKKDWIFQDDWFQFLFPNSKRFQQNNSWFTLHIILIILFLLFLLFILLQSLLIITKLKNDFQIIRFWIIWKQVLRPFHQHNSCRKSCLQVQRFQIRLVFHAIQIQVMNPTINIQTINKCPSSIRLTSYRSILSNPSVSPRNSSNWCRSTSFQLCHWI